MGAAIIVLGPGALAVARQLRERLPGSAIHGLRDRVGDDVDVPYEQFGRHLCELHAAGTPIVAICAAGIVIRALAARVAGAQKDADPAVLAVAEDGSAVVPLLGGLSGVNDLAREIGAALGVAPAITTSGELRFGACLLDPPEGYALASLDEGKRFVSDLLAGAPVRISGEAPWLEPLRFTRTDDAARVIRITPQAGDGEAGELRIHPRSVAVAIDCDREDADALERDVGAALDRCGLARRSLATLIAPRRHMRRAALREAATRLGAAVRYVEIEHDAAPSQWLACGLPAPYRLAEESPTLAIAVAPSPLDPAQIGQARGSVAVVGLGPGSRDFMIPAARAALERATDILGYSTYVEMAGPLGPHQRAHGTDNREEMQRARHAFALASEGRHVAIVSSGDPGIFAMAAAVLEALESAADPAWHDVELTILPGVSAAIATAAMAGAPLGHDFCLISLSDNLKPWDVIEKRLRLAAEADLVMGFYNPISKARPWQLERALELIRMYHDSNTPVVLGRDIQRPGARLVSLSLGELTADQVDMRTTVIVGSSTTRRFPRDDASDWVYTPRWYPAPN
ncbi:precorrin-3B C(17)-methyltransferase [Lysobacter korlensis]|uniref:Precorrin-3B C(17)-methyltransferase n=1 Tax=Lysobacter korlensis TaxID=553636 RepID=A0ABV6RS13_9GAMM